MRKNNHYNAKNQPSSAASKGLPTFLVVCVLIGLFFDSIEATNLSNKQNNFLKENIGHQTRKRLPVSKDAKITALNPPYNVARSFQLSIVCQGELVDAGNCSPEPLLGLLKKNAQGGWDTIVDIKKKGINLCGIGNHVWNNDTILVPFNSYRPVDQIEGQYCFTFLTYKRGKEIMKTSNDFEIVYIPFENQNIEASKGFYDTTHTGSFIFHHLRVFTSVNLEEQQIWERLIIQGSDGKYLFDKVFTYRSYRGAPIYFSTGDFNRDGQTDFKLLNNYYLYNPLNATFEVNEKLSNASSFEILPDNNTLRARYHMVPPLGEAYSPVKEATFQLPSLQFVSGTGWTRSVVPGQYEKIDSTRLIFPIRLEYPFSPPQPSMAISTLSGPQLLTNKIHYFQNQSVDTVYLFCNGYDKLSDPTRLTFVVEVARPQNKEWTNYSTMLPAECKIIPLEDGCYKIPIAVIVANKDGGMDKGLAPGRYRCKVYAHERLMVSSPDFFVHEE